MDNTLEHTDLRLRNVHNPSNCAGEYCCLHKRSDHSMRSFPQHFRDDAGFMERTCPHGIGHPDPDDPFAPDVHGCDGCCAGAYRTDDFYDEAEDHLSLP